MANNFGGGSFSIMDWDREVSNFSFNTGAITAVSIAATLTQFGALRTATEALTKGTMVAEALYVNRTKLSNVPPSDPEASRESKWLVTYEDTTEFFDSPVNAIPNAGYGKVFTVEIPCADGSGTHLLDQKDDANLADADWVAWIAAFEALVRTPYGGTANVLNAIRVGRNI